MIDRDRVSERVSFSTLRLELRRSIRPLIILAIGFAIAVGAAEYILYGISGGIGGTHTMKFEVSDATGVVPGRAESRFYGIRSGFITNAQLNKNGDAVLTVTVANKFGKVYKNATAQVRPNTALNDMYLDVTNRGTPSAGVAGPNYTIPIDQTTSPTNLADVLDTFSPDIRGQLNNILDQGGNGLQDRGIDLQEAFVELAPLLSIAGNVSQQLAVRSDLTKQLVHNAAILSKTLAGRSVQLHDLIMNGTTSLEALSTEGGSSLRQTIANFPGMLHTTNTIEEAFLGLAPNLNAAVTALKPVANDLPSGLTDLKSLAERADPAVVKLEAPVQKLVPLANALKPLAADLSTALTRIKPQVPDVNRATTVLSTCGTDVNEFFNWDESMSKFFDALGPMVRGNANFGFYTAGAVKDENFVQGHNCGGGEAIGAVPVPKEDGPAPAP